MFPDDNSYYLLKLCGPVPANGSMVEVKMGRKLVNKGPSWKRPVIVIVANVEVQMGGLDFNTVKVCIFLTEQKHVFIIYLQLLDTFLCSR